MAEAPMTNTPAAEVQPNLPDQTPTMESAAPVGANNATAANAPAYGEPGAAAQPSTVVPAGAPAPAQPAAPPKHARLLAMVTGLADALSASATSIATHGREGGAEEVQQLQGQRQQMKQSADTAAQAKAAAAQDYAIKTQTLNGMNLNNRMMTATFNDKVTQSHMEAQEQKTKLAGEEFNLFAGTGMSPDAIDAMVNGKTASADTKTNSVLQSNAERQYRIASQLLPAGNPSLVAMRSALDAPNQTPQALVMANAGLQKELAGQEGVNDAKIKQAAANESAPLGDRADALNAAMTQRYQILNPGKPLPPGLTMSATSLPKDFDRADKVLQQTENAQSTQASRNLTDQIRQQTLDLLKGPQGIDPNLSGPAYLDAVTKADPGQADMIKGYGQGRLVLSPAVARSAQGQALTKQILRAYPQYVAAKAEGYQKQYNEFISGKTGTAINSYKTSLDHLNDAFDNVERASAVDLNNPASTIHRQLDVDKEFLSTELAKAVANGNMTEGEKDGMLKAIDGKTLGVATKGAYQDKLRETVRLLGGKLDAYQSQWKSSAVEGVEPPSNLTDAADATKKLAGGASAGAHVIDIGGVHYTYNGSGDTTDLKNYTKK
jgi:hypothetical protein